jgi:NADPH-dependent ferric siderophore reductase
MINQQELIIQSGIVLANKQIAAHTFHLKIQSDDFAKMKYAAGFTVDMFLGNPFCGTPCEDRKYSFWHYNPIYNIADFAICTFSNGKGAEWIQQLQPGESIYFKPPKGKLLADNSANNYLLIGNITSLSHLYEINRSLAVSKNIFSFIYAEQQADFFKDIDKNAPLNLYIIPPALMDKAVDKIISALPKIMDDTIAYIFGHPEICIALHNYLKLNHNMPVQNLRTKPFWKSTKEKAALLTDKQAH